MIIFIGLGNPEKKYDKTYHNLGFMVIDKLSERLSVSLGKKKFESLLGEGVYNNQEVVLVKPQTYMNLSGYAVSKFSKKYKDARIIVICDDIDLDIGKFRYRESGSSGTHNGLRSIVNLMGQNFERLRIGIGKPEGDLADYVLSKIKNIEEMDGVLDEVANYLIGLI